MVSGIFHRPLGGTLGKQNVCPQDRDRVTFAAVGEVAEWSKALDWNSSYARKGIRGFESHPLRQYFPGCAQRAPRGRLRSMVARVGSSATVNRESRQARKGATVTARPGAGGVPARDTSRLRRTPSA